MINRPGAEDQTTLDGLAVGRPPREAVVDVGGERGRDGDGGTILAAEYKAAVTVAVGDRDFGAALAGYVDGAVQVAFDHAGRVVDLDIAARAVADDEAGPVAEDDAAAVVDVLQAIDVGEMDTVGADDRAVRSGVAGSDA